MKRVITYGTFDLLHHGRFRMAPDFIKLDLVKATQAFFCKISIIGAKFVCCLG